MRGVAIAATLGFVLSSASALAQATSQPAGQVPAQPPAPAAAPQPPAQPPVPFPPGAKVAFVNLQAVAQLTADGKAAALKVNALAQKKQAEGESKSKALVANQQKLQTTGGIMSDTARVQLEKEIERQQVEGQRFEQDAQAELNELQQVLQQEFQTKLMPVLSKLSEEKGLQVLFSAGDAGVIWIDPGLDLTLEAVKRMDATKTAGK